MRSLFSRKRTKGWLAVNLLPEQVDIAHVRRNGSGRPQVLLCDSYRKEGSAFETLSRLRKELHLNRYHCVALLDPKDYQLLQVEAPNVPQAELKTALRWRIKDLIDYPVEAATIDVLDTPADKTAPARGHSVYAVSAHNDTVKKVMDLFADARIPLSAIDIQETAQRNIAALYETEGRGLAMLAFDDSGGLLTFTYGGELYLSRRIEISMSNLLEPGEEHWTVLRRQQHYERIVLELQRSLDHFDRQFHFITVAKLLLAPMPISLGLHEYLASNLYIAVETLDLGQVVDFPNVPELRERERQARCLYIIGAALRGGEQLQ